MREVNDHTMVSGSYDPETMQSTLPGAPYPYHQTREAHAWVRVPDLGELIG